MMNTSTDQFTPPPRPQPGMLLGCASASLQCRGQLPVEPSPRHGVTMGVPARPLGRRAARLLAENGRSIVLCRPGPRARR